MGVESIVAVVSVLVATGGLLIAWLRYRDAELRREEALRWASEVITELQTLRLIIDPKLSLIGDEPRRKRLAAIAIGASVLVERGRLFFRNEITDNHGAEKRSAYRGYRPRILDQLVIAHQVASRWPAADADERLRLALVAEDCLQEFVSLAQEEVGRERTVSRYSKQGGEGESLSWHLDKLKPERVDRVRRAASGAPQAWPAQISSAERPTMVR